MPPADPASSTSRYLAVVNQSRHPCLTCQRRKVKCDRTFPCTGCLTYGHDCKQPEIQREPRRPARKSQDLLGRIRQLEDSLEETRALLRLHVSPKKEPETDITIEETSNVKTESASLDDLLGHLIIDEDKSRYLSMSSWANFTLDVADPGTFLEENNVKNFNNSIESSQWIASSLFGEQSSPMRLETPELGLEVLWPIYVQNVDPIVKILHIPSLRPVIEAAITDYHTPNDGFNCLFAAIKFGAVVSMQDLECREYGSSRLLLLQLFRREVQEALHTAHFLTSQSLITLQAFVIFIICSRWCEQARTMWMLCGIGIRLAQSLGLHRDGSIMELSVFTIELRRRLWWYLRECDILVAEECGFSPSSVFKADVKMPLNINDADISIADTTAPIERSGFTEITCALIRFELCKKLHEFHSYDNRKTMGDLNGSRKDVLSQCLHLKECKEFLETKYFRFCSPAIPFQRMALRQAHRIILKLSLVIQCPLFHVSGYKTADHLFPVMIEQLSAISCEIIESQHKSIHDPETMRWSWYLRTHIHWHPVACLLNLICCSNMPWEQLQRPWRAVNYALEDCIGVVEDSRREIWRPLQSLVVRAKAKMQQLGEDHAHTNPLFDLNARIISANSFEALSGTLFGGFTALPGNQFDSGEPIMGTKESDISEETTGFFLASDDFLLFDDCQSFISMGDFMFYNEG